MLELYLKLYEARSVNFEARGNAHGIGRDETLIRSHGNKPSPVRHRMVMAEACGISMQCALDEWAKSIVGNLSQDVAAVALGFATTRAVDEVSLRHHHAITVNWTSAEIKRKLSICAILVKAMMQKKRPFRRWNVIHAAIGTMQKKS